MQGGVWSSTVVRNDGDAMDLIKKQYKSGKLLATVCSGSTVLINAKIISPRLTVTGSPSIAIDLENAGATYLDQPVVRVNNLITGRSPGGEDNLLFTTAIAKALKERRQLKDLVRSLKKILSQ